jgi:hypothetical protein
VTKDCQFVNLGFVCEFVGKGRGGLWRERKLEKSFTFFEKVFFYRE